MATNEDLRNIYDKDSTEIFVNDIMSYLLVDNGRKGDANLHVWSKEYLGLFD